MRFMMFMIPNIKEENWMPSAAAVAAMSTYNDSLKKAGVLLSLDGLQPPAKGARVSFAGGKPKIADGPFAGAKDVIGGYWMIQVKSKAEAVEWAARCPAADGNVIEVRQVAEMSDFPPEIRKAAGR
ncbi:MAG TPA: YciI family protein [Stellaceae bacterium]|nr:YciI family protein [Stellaceae bacterium]